jgi:hypothetical protein
MDVRGLLYYLFTEGLAGEKGLESDHLDARIVACWDGHPRTCSRGSDRTVTATSLSWWTCCPTRSRRWG